MRFHPKIVLGIISACEDPILNKTCINLIPLLATLIFPKIEPIPRELIMRNTKILVVCATLCVSLSAVAVQDQQPKEAPPAPVPAQIVTGQKVFIANGGGLDASSAKQIGISPDRAYNDFYAAMKSWGRYELVSSPADADVIFEICFSTVVESVWKGSSFDAFQFRLVILDPKTHVSLWAFTKQARSKKDIDRLETSLMDDVKNLAARSAATTYAPNK